MGLLLNLGRGWRPVTARPPRTAAAVDRLPEDYMTAGTIVYLYAGHRALEERDGITGNLRKRTIWSGEGLDTLLRVDDFTINTGPQAGERVTFFFTTDRMGSPTAALIADETTGDAVVVERYAFDMHGRLFATPGQAACRRTDVDCDGLVGATDLALVRNAFTPSAPAGTREDVCGNPQGDPHGAPDGEVDAEDVACVRADLGLGLDGLYTTATEDPDPAALPRPDKTFSLHGLTYDHATGLVFARARLYHPKLGRWMARDPKGYVDGGNLYEAFGSNPARFRDPLGLFQLSLNFTEQGRVQLGGRNNSDSDWFGLGYLDPAHPGFVLMTAADGIRIVPLTTIIDAADTSPFLNWLFDTDPDRQLEWQAWAVDKGLRIGDTPESIRGIKGAALLRLWAMAAASGEELSAEDAAYIINAADMAASYTSDLLLFYGTIPFDLATQVKSITEAAYYGRALRQVGRVERGNRAVPVRTAGRAATSDDLFAGVRGTNLKALNNMRVGDIGEDIARRWLSSQGYTDIVAIKNRSNQGLDLVARTPDNRVAFFEVKTSRFGQPGELSARQRDMNFFVNDVLERAAEGRGGYRNLDQATREQAGSLLRELQRNPGDMSGAVIGIELHGETLRISSWPRNP